MKANGWPVGGSSVTYKPIFNVKNAHGDKMDVAFEVSCGCTPLESCLTVLHETHPGNCMDDGASSSCVWHGSV